METFWGLQYVAIAPLVTQFACIKLLALRIKEESLCTEPMRNAHL